MNATAKTNAAAQVPSAAAGTAIAPSLASEDKMVKYVPFGEQDELTLTVGQVKNFISVHTKQGGVPSLSDIVQFLQLCKARKLNPWVRDAYLVGFDEYKNQRLVGHKFTMIVSIQALLKRAEAHPEYDGNAFGVIVIRSEQITELEGSFVLPTDELVGAWATVYRRDQSHTPTVRISRGGYDTGRSRWAIDPAGMLAKCALAGALRLNFPGELGAMYIAEEGLNNDEADMDGTWQAPDDEGDVETAKTTTATAGAARRQRADDVELARKAGAAVQQSTAATQPAKTEPAKAAPKASAAPTATREEDPNFDPFSPQPEQTVKPRRRRGRPPRAGAVQEQVAPETAEEVAEETVQEAIEPQIADEAGISQESTVDDQGEIHEPDQEEVGVYDDDAAVEFMQVWGMPAWAKAACPLQLVDNELPEWLYQMVDALTATRNDKTVREIFDRFITMAEYDADSVNVRRLCRARVDSL